MISLLHIIEFILILISFLIILPLVGTVLPPINRSDLPSRKGCLLSIGIIAFTILFISGVNYYVSDYNFNHKSIDLQSVPAALKVNANGYWIVQCKITKKSNQIDIVLRQAPLPTGKGSLFKDRLLQDSKDVCD